MRAFPDANGVGTGTDSDGESDHWHSLFVFWESASLRWCAVRARFLLDCGLNNNRTDSDPSPSVSVLTGVQTRSGKTLATLRSHKGLVTGVTFSPDGGHIASSSEDKCVRVFQEASPGRWCPTLLLSNSRSLSFVDAVIAGVDTSAANKVVLAQHGAVTEKPEPIVACSSDDEAGSDSDSAGRAGVSPVSGSGAASSVDDELDSDLPLLASDTTALASASKHDPIDSKLDPSTSPSLSNLKRAGVGGKATTGGPLAASGSTVATGSGSASMGTTAAVLSGGNVNVILGMLSEVQAEQTTLRTDVVSLRTAVQSQQALLARMMAVLTRLDESHGGAGSS